MADHTEIVTELLEVALNSLPEGFLLVDGEGEVIFWNEAAEEITGYSAAELMAKPLPGGLEPLIQRNGGAEEFVPGAAPTKGRSTLVQAQHRVGRGVAVITRVLILHGAKGERSGAAAFFRPAESLEALPHGDRGEGAIVDEGHAELEERLQVAFDDLTRGGPLFGVIWVGVDQAQDLCRTHGVNACQTMLDKVKCALAAGLRPGEELGYWGDGEFLVLTHARNAEVLAQHAQMLAGLARTADFRWWGDRVSITVSVGAAQAVRGDVETLTQLLERASGAMETSMRNGGNRAMLAADPMPAKVEEDSVCSPS